MLHDTRGPEGDAAPLTFDTGMGLVPEAVDIAVRLMTPQEVSRVSATPQYAYQGRTDRPPVRPLQPLAGAVLCVVVTGGSVSQNRGLTTLSLLSTSKRSDAASGMRVGSRAVSASGLHVR